MKKKAQVHTNDEKNPVLPLTVIGKVERFVIIKPNRVVLNGYTDSEISTSVEILQEEKYPFKVISAKVKRGENIRFELSELDGINHRGYTLNVENLKKNKGRFYDQVVLKTNNEIMPEIVINVSGFIKERGPFVGDPPPNEQ